MANDPYTLLIGVSANGTAYGHLYADDGKSFEYNTRDDYVVMDVHLSANGIKGSVKHSSESDFAQQYVERIIVYGMSRETGYIEGGMGLDIIPLDNDSGFIIRNPKVKINENWFINLR
ncbi:hypothetical protein FF38_13409 [Lucilia cuprina]|uniref:Uncharacterized protein n=1 Tax=Lucilia cuprina TaxID=7375 RepID=A0A0L0CCI4_LUCCU|nr:hypothetical protein FF38_13409 [Lucilia cuprina]